MIPLEKRAQAFLYSVGMVIISGVNLTPSGLHFVLQQHTEIGSGSPSSLLHQFLPVATEYRIGWLFVRQSRHQIRVSWRLHYVLD
jgi:hypothetical protein